MQTLSETQRRANALRAEAARVRPLDAELADRLAAGADRLALRAAVRADDRARWPRDAADDGEDAVTHGPDSQFVEDAVAHGPASEAHGGPA